MSRIVRTPQADLDVFEIAIYIAQDNIEASDRFIDGLDVKLALLARSPSLGRAVMNSRQASGASPSGGT